MARDLEMVSAVAGGQQVPPASDASCGVRRGRAVRLALAGVLCALACGCGGGGGSGGSGGGGNNNPPPPPPVTASLLVVTNGTAGSIDIMTIDDATGVPTPVSGSPFTDGTSATSAALGPQKQFLYVASSAGQIRGYVLDPTTLKPTAMSGSPFMTSADSVAIAVDPSGKFVLTANGTSNSISVFSIAASGALSEVAGSPFANAGGPNAIVVTAGNYVYTTNQSGGSVSAFRLDGASGALTAVTGSPFSLGTQLNGLVVDPAGTHLYAAESQVGAVAEFTIDASTGALTAIAGSPIQANGPHAFSPVVDGQDNRMHVADGTNVDCFRVTNSPAAGGLSHLGLSITNGGASAITIDRQDNFLYALDPVNNQVEVFSIDTTDGSLTLLGNSPFALFSGAANQSLGPTSLLVAH